MLDNDEMTPDEYMNAISSNGAPKPPPVLSSIVGHIDPASLDGSNPYATVRDIFAQLPAVSPDDAWALLYRTVLWYEARSGLPSIYDANELQPEGSWFARARDAERFFAARWGIDPQDVRERMDLVMRARQSRYPHENKDNRRNYSGLSFEAVMYHLLRTVSAVPEHRVDAQKKGFTGGWLGGLKTIPDLVLYGTDKKVTDILSLKWTLRDDRLHQLVSESESWCREYPSARIWVVTAELGSSRLRKALGHTREEDGRFRYHGVYHVSPPLLNAVGCEIDNRRFKSVADLLRELQVK